MVAACTCLKRSDEAERLSQYNGSNSRRSSSSASATAIDGSGPPRSEPLGEGAVPRWQSVLLSGYGSHLAVGVGSVRGEVLVGTLGDLVRLWRSRSGC